MQARNELSSFGLVQSTYFQSSTAHCEHFLCGHRFYNCGENLADTMFNPSFMSASCVSYTEVLNLFVGKLLELPLLLHLFCRNFFRDLVVTEILISALKSGAANTVPRSCRI